MSKKELTESERYKKEYSTLVNINQRLKTISDCYYISHNNTIYMKSLVPFIEKTIVLHDDIMNEQSLFNGAMIMPNAFFEFTKNAKKTKLTINPTLESIYLGQCDNTDISHKINIVNIDPRIDNDFLNSQIIPSMYKRFFTLSDNCYTKYDDYDVYYDISKDDIEVLLDSEPVYISLYNAPLTLTKQLVLDLKKEDSLSIARTCFQKIEETKKRVFYTIKHTTNMYTSYTIFNTLQ